VLEMKVLAAIGGMGIGLVMLGLAALTAIGLVGW
jgi:hypothetical protein